MAKARAIEPDMIDNTGYGHFLPATVAAVTLHMITISANYAINNNIYSRIKE
jgi:hypothetical protein